MGKSTINVVFSTAMLVYQWVPWNMCDLFSGQALNMQLKLFQSHTIAKNPLVLVVWYSMEV